MMNETGSVPVSSDNEEMQDNIAGNRKRTYVEAHRLQHVRNLLAKVGDIIGKYRSASVSGSLKCPLQMMVVFTDENGRVRVKGTKLLRLAFNEANLRKTIRNSPYWDDDEVLFSSELDEATEHYLPLPDGGSLDNLTSRDQLETFLRRVLRALNNNRRVVYGNAKKPEYWPPGIDFGNPKSRENFTSADSRKYKTFGDLLRYIIGYIYAKHQCYHLLGSSAPCPVTDAIEHGTDRPAVPSDYGESHQNTEAGDFDPGNLNYCRSCECQSCSHRRQQLGRGERTHYVQSHDDQDFGQDLNEQMEFQHPVEQVEVSSFFESGDGLDSCGDDSDRDQDEICRPLSNQSPSIDSLPSQASLVSECYQDELCHQLSNHSHRGTSPLSSRMQVPSGASRSPNVEGTVPTFAPANAQDGEFDENCRATMSNQGPPDQRSPNQTMASRDVFGIDISPGYEVSSNGDVDRRRRRVSPDLGKTTSTKKSCHGNSEHDVSVNFDVLLSLVHRLRPDFAGELAERMLEFSNHERIRLAQDPAFLKAKVDEMAIILEIERGDQLADDVINIYLQLIKSLSPATAGLIEPAVFAVHGQVASIRIVDASQRSAQIHHLKGGHWVVTCNLGDSVVRVYDSLATQSNNRLDRCDDLRRQIVEFYDALKNDEGEIRVQYFLLPKQQGGIDCGLFALAYLTAIVLGLDVECVRFNQSQMRRHLINALQLKHVSMFPNVDTTRSKYVMKALSIFCCNKIIKGARWVGCSGRCQKWWHLDCLTGSKKRQAESAFLRKEKGEYFCSMLCRNK